MRTLSCKEHKLPLCITSAEDLFLALRHASFLRLPSHRMAFSSVLVSLLDHAFSVSNQSDLFPARRWVKMFLLQARVAARVWFLTSLMYTRWELVGTVRFFA